MRRATSVVQHACFARACMATLTTRFDMRAVACHFATDHICGPGKFQNWVDEGVNLTKTG